MRSSGKPEQPSPVCIREDVAGSIGGRSLTAIRRSCYAPSRASLYDSSMQYRALIDLKDKSVLLIDDRNRSYVQITVDAFRSQAAEGMRLLAGPGGKRLPVRETGRTEKVQGRSCFEVSLFFEPQSLKMDLWLSKEIPAPLDAYFIFTANSGIGETFPGMLTLLRKHNAYIVESTMTMLRPGGLEVRLYSRLSGIEEIDQSDGAFAPPKGYEKLSVK
ncbi:MAG TPA: hypothetical protein PKJ16_14445 [Spirochaetota bacterium]|nr:hypothetical protein [Spirochaetota bacterium]